MKKECFSTITEKMMFGLFLFSLIGSRFVSAADNTTWPGCYVTGSDYSGDDVISGLRFSEDECAKWCAKVGPRYFDRLKIFLQNNNL